MSILTTAGWVLWTALLTASLVGIWNELVIRPRRERRMRELVEIVSCREVLWAPNDWIET